MTLLAVGRIAVAASLVAGTTVAITGGWYALAGATAIAQMVTP